MLITRLVCIQRKSSRFLSRDPERPTIWGRHGKKLKKKRLHFLSLAAKASETNYARSIFFRCHRPSSGSLILCGQFVQINEDKGKPALFSIYLLRPPPTPPQLTYFPFLIFPFLFLFPPPHRPHIDPTLTLHRPFVLTQFVCIDINP